MRPLFYVLEGHTPVPCNGEEWSQRFGQIEERRVARTEINAKVYVSTVFLGIDHDYSYKGPPILFETMIFGLPKRHKLSDYQTRCATWEEAEAMHQTALRKIRAFPEAS